MPIEHKHQPTVYLLVLWSRLDGADACNVWKPAHNRSGVLLFHRSIISSNAFSALFPLFFSSFRFYHLFRLVFMSSWTLLLSSVCPCNIRYMSRSGPPSCNHVYFYKLRENGCAHINDGNSRKQKWKISYSLTLVRSRPKGTRNLIIRFVTT